MKTAFGTDSNSYGKCTTKNFNVQYISLKRDVFMCIFFKYRKSFYLNKALYAELAYM